MKKRNIHKMKHKVVGRDILYFNGENWPIRETLKNNKKAKDKFKELKDLNKLSE